MAGWRLYCPKCSWEGRGEEYYHKCPRCGSPLEIRGEIPRPKEPLLGEGETPLVEIGRVMYKLEYVSPTGSFKDRGASLSVYLASLLDYKCTVEDSSGNTGLAVAAYAARLGLKARIHAPRTIALGKARLIRRLGAELVLHESREEAARAAERDAGNCYYVSHAYSPIFIKGVESIAAELMGVAVGSTIFVPASSGTLLLGIHRGLKTLGVRRQVRIVAVQSPQAASIEGLVPTLYKTEEREAPLLDALVYRNPPRRDQMAEAADALVVVGERETLLAIDKLYRKGLIVEPSSATVQAALDNIEDNLGRPVLILTGSGLKYVEPSQNH